MPDGVHPVTGEVYALPIGKLAEALSAAQGVLKGAIMDAENPAYKREGAVSKYADLAAVWDACREALSANKLAVIQTTHAFGDHWVLRTTLAHASGESISGDFPLRPMKPDMQGFMGAVTYARRAGLAAICGVAPRGEDDDGNAASGVNAAKPGKTVDKSPPATVKASQKTAPPKEPPPDVKAKVKPGCDARYDEICGIRKIDTLLALEQEEEFKKQMKWLNENWPEQHERLRTVFVERETQLHPAGA